MDGNDVSRDELEWCLKETNIALIDMYESVKNNPTSYSIHVMCQSLIKRKETLESELIKHGHGSYVDGVFKLKGGKK